MKKTVFYIFLSFIMSSCLTVKVYKTEKEPKKEQKPVSTKTSLIPSGIIVPLVEGDSTEVYFPGEDQALKIKAFTFMDDDGHIQTIKKKEHLKDTLYKRIILKIKKESIQPIIIINGVEMEMDIKSIDLDSIESINMYRGAKAVETFGEKGKNGVIVVKKKN